MYILKSKIAAEHLIFSMKYNFMGKHNEFGKEGEQIAADFLLKKGYTISYRNYRYLKAEIDIIAKKDEIVAIVEVRSRRSDYIENIAETVTQKKIKLLVMAADYYILSTDLDVEVRFDIITILKNKNRFEIEHLENAFYHF
ncbi:MAG: putative endonuclease [Maribacter sp.]|jgi:putative endonuclease